MNVWILIVWWFIYRVFKLQPSIYVVFTLRLVVQSVEIAVSLCHWHLKAWGIRGGEDSYQIGFHRLWYRDCTSSLNRVVGIRWSVVGMMTGLRCGCWWNRVAIAEGEEIFLFPKSCRPHMGTTQPCILGTTGEKYPGSKRAMAWSWPLAPSSAKVENEWSCTFSPWYALVACTRASYALTCLYMASNVTTNTNCQCFHHNTWKPDFILEFNLYFSLTGHCTSGMFMFYCRIACRPVVNFHANSDLKVFPVSLLTWIHLVCE